VESREILVYYLFKGHPKKRNIGKCLSVKNSARSHSWNVFFKLNDFLMGALIISLLPAALAPYNF
jgi:hypothetical protein